MGSLWGGFGEALGRFWLWGSSGDALGRLWESFGEALGGSVEALGRLWEALGSLWRGFGDARRPPPNKTIYKNVGSTQTPDKPALLAQC